MKFDNFLVLVASLAVIFSVAGTYVTYNSLSEYKGFLTGFVVEQGQVNVTVESLASIEIYSAGGTPGSKVINWGTGRVTPGAGNFAILATNGTVSGADSGASWTPVNGGFLIRNIGNTNVSLQLHADSVAAGFIGGTSPSFQYNLSNIEAGSCATWSAGVEKVYKEFTSSATPVCTKFRFEEANDELRMDILLRIPSDSLTGTRSSTVVLTYVSA